MSTIKINGNLYDWASVAIQLPGGVVVGCDEITYEDEAPIEPRYGKGRTPRGYGKKNYKGSGSLSLDLDEFERFRTSQSGRVYSKRFDIVVSYANEGQETIIDTLRNCMATKTSTSAKQDEDNVGIRKIDFTILSPIEWNGVAAISE